MNHTVVSNALNIWHLFSKYCWSTRCDYSLRTSHLQRKVKTFIHRATTPPQLQGGVPVHAPLHSKLGQLCLGGVCRRVAHKDSGLNLPHFLFTWPQICNENNVSHQQWLLWCEKHVKQILWSLQTQETFKTDFMLTADTTNGQNRFYAHPSHKK